MKNNQKTFPVTSIHFWRSYLVQMRPYLFFVSGFTGLAGMALSNNLDMQKPLAIILFTAFFLSYGFGQALTDCYQTDTDKISAPYRPLSKGLVSIISVKIVSITGLALVAGVLISQSWINLFFCSLSIFGLWTYTYIKKSFWYAGPFYNAWIVSLLVIMGYLGCAESNVIKSLDPNVLKVMFITFLSYTNFVLVGYLKDISADKATGYHTFPVIFGWTKTIWVAHAIVLICSFFCIFLFSQTWQSKILGIIAFIVAAYGQLYAQFTEDKSEKNSALPILSTVRAFLLWHASIVCSLHPHLMLFCIVLYLAFEITIYYRPMHSQI